jgi:hypothetical protein
MKLAAIVAVMFCSWVIGTAALSAPADFPSLRKAADDFAAKAKPGFNLLKVELTASNARKSLQINDGDFHYFGPIDKMTYRVPGVTTRIGDMQMLRVLVRPLEGAHYPKVVGDPYQLPIDEGVWQMTPVPRNILSAEDAIRRLNRDIPGDPYRRPRVGAPHDPNRRDLFELKLVQIGDARTASSRDQFKWVGMSAAFGFRANQAEFFAKTGPLGKWIWWTRVEQDRPDPAADRRRAGTPRRVSEYIYIDAVTGKAESHCHGADWKPIAC